MPVAFGIAGALAAWLEPFTALFTRPTWRHVLVLVAGAVLTSNRRTVTAALRATGHDRDPGVGGQPAAIEGDVHRLGGDR
jgi:hypothetical protein